MTKYIVKQDPDINVKEIRIVLLRTRHGQLCLTVEADIDGITTMVNTQAYQMQSDVWLPKLDTFVIDGMRRGTI